MWSFSGCVRIIRLWLGLGRGGGCSELIGWASYKCRYEQDNDRSWSIAVCLIRDSLYGRLSDSSTALVSLRQNALFRRKVEYFMHLSNILCKPYVLMFTGENSSLWKPFPVTGPDQHLTWPHLPSLQKRSACPPACPRWPLQRHTHWEAPVLSLVSYLLRRLCVWLNSMCNFS